MVAEIFSPVTLPRSGRTIPNRLAKVALYEHLAKLYGGPPNKYHMALYSEWAKHGWGMIVTGNVQVSRNHLTLGRDIVVPEVFNEKTLAPFKTLARTIHAEDLRELSTSTLAIMQLSHVGRQSPNILGGRWLGVPPMAPSPVRLGSNKRVRSCDGATTLDAGGTPSLLFRVMFHRPREMMLDDIKHVQQAFIRGALTALEAGFDGVQLHCAHGYLLAQFLNPKCNIRNDEYAIRDSLRMVREIVEGIRAVVPNNFVIGMKINSADYVESGERPSDDKALQDSQRVLDHICTIASWDMVDFIEISGGDYESPDFMSTKGPSPRQAFFAQFAKMARDCVKTALDGSEFKAPLILLTGGLRSPAHLQGALDAGHADLLGIGRGSVLRPDMPALLRERLRDATTNTTPIASDDRLFAHEPDDDVQLPNWVPQIPLVGAGVSMAWYNVRMRRIASSQLKNCAHGKACPAPPPTLRMSGLEVIIRLWVWLEWHELMSSVLVWCVPILMVVGLMALV